ncbi:MAG TPA: type II secretion system F family protein [Xanthobacteraceae bacterium]|nr:type II secretion system F family protein [Xanthobacteraceae bacterium]
MPMNTIAIFFLVSAACGGVAWVFLYPVLSGERHAERRRMSIAQSSGPVRKAAGRAPQRLRREQIEQTLKGVEERHKNHSSPPLAVRIAQAGLTWSPRAFYMVSATMALVALLLTLVATGDVLIAAPVAFVAGLGAPRWLLSYLKKRREQSFLTNFPDTIDVIVRGIKAGLPLLDSMKIIVNDGPEPIRSEFKALLDTQAIGIPLGEACGKLYERIPLPEANFFGIVIAIQQKTGGNLAEALGNLSRVLRDRKKMKAKIKAMSTEAKASGAIIGALPIVVGGAVYVTSPDFIGVLFTHPVGQMMLAGSALWMLLGILVMKKMINFDF